MARLCCEHLRHMEREEQEANRMLQAHRTDDELGALHQRIVGSIAPERVARWLELILPAASAPERRELLAGLSRAVPAPAFEALTSPARAALGAVAWTAALA
jgi:hypothetical protein